MKREATTLGDLNEGDVFYFPDEKERVAYQCLGWNAPQFKQGYKRWTRKYINNKTRNKETAIRYEGSGKKAVIKIVTK